MKNYTKLIIAAIIALVFIGTFVFLWQKSRPKEVTYQEFTPEKMDIRKTTIITDKIEPMPEFFMKKWLRNIGNKLSANGWATLSIVLFAILLASVFLYLTTRSIGLKKTTFFTNILLVLLCLCSVIFASQKRNYLSTHNEAIVMTPTITVKSSPSQSGVDLFVLHEGTKVEILDGVEKWDKIRIADGSVGWMPSVSSIKY